MEVPRFEPFRAIHYSSSNVETLTSPPYDVFDEKARALYAAKDPHNIVHVDYPVESDGIDHYNRASRNLRQWLNDGTLVHDPNDSYYVYRMRFVDENGRERRTNGVVGAMQVADAGSPEVLPHERTTPKAHTDRLELIRATRANLSPVWGLSLTDGLTGLLLDNGELVSVCTDEEGVEHRIERINDPNRIESIRRSVSASPIVIADGHHRYSVSRVYRDERRLLGESDGELIMAYVAELVDDQLSIAAIHRMLNTSADEVVRTLGPYFTTEGETMVNPDTLMSMRATGSVCVVDPEGRGTLMSPIPHRFEGMRNLDSIRLETALGSLAGTLRYQHGLANVINSLQRGDALSAILINPVSITDIRHTAETGELMPPKSTFFSPKLRTGMLLRDLTTN